MHLVAAILIAIPFSVFLNLPPLPDFPKQLLGILVVLVFVQVVLFRSGKTVSYSKMLLPFLLVMAWFGLVSYLNYGDFYFSLWNLIFVMFFGGLCLVLSPCAVRVWGDENVKRTISFGLVLAASVVCCFGLLRFYGIFKFLVPWVQVDGNRLIGPWGQPNLTGLIIVLGLMSLVSISSARNKVLGAAFLFISAIFIYSGIMTGSRAWLVLFFGYIFLLFISGFTASEPRGRFFLSGSRLSALVLLFVFSIIYPVSDDIDASIAGPLQEYGVLDRYQASEMLERHKDFSGGARLNEWKKIYLYPILAEDPWFGYGVGRYGAFSNQAAVERGLIGHNKNYWNNAHNFLIMALVEGGFIGLFLVASAFFVLLFCLLKNVLAGVSFYYSSLAIVLLVQNLVEFSFWYLPFLFLFLFVVGLLFKSGRFDFSHAGTVKSLSVGVALVFVPIGFLASKDYFTITNYFYKSFYSVARVEGADEYALKLSKTSDILGYAAWETDILANQPPVNNWEHQLSRVVELWTWRPIQAYSVRRAGLLTALSSEKACNALRTTTLLYPDSFPKLNEELRFFYSIKGEEYPIKSYLSCAMSGMNRWLDG